MIRFRLNEEPVLCSALIKRAPDRIRPCGQTMPEVILWQRKAWPGRIGPTPSPATTRRRSPLFRGKAKHGKERAKPIIPGTNGPDMKVYHGLKGDGSVGDADL